MSAIGVVAIGRNEGERLRRCLESLDGHGLTVVYVDSGSTDDSVALARSRASRWSIWTCPHHSRPPGAECGV